MQTTLTEKEFEFYFIRLKLETFRAQIHKDILI